VDVSNKCSETAAELLAELKKLQLDSRGGLRQAFSKSIRAIGRKNFLKQIQDKLDSYQRILDTRILVRLDSNSIRQTKDFDSLDRNVRDLVTAVNEGRATFAQLIADHAQTLHDHIDCRLDAYARSNHDIEVQQQFKDSLFFPEIIISRQEQIHEPYKGTCRWIFDSKNFNVGDRSGGSFGDVHTSGGQGEQTNQHDAATRIGNRDSNDETGNEGEPETSKGSNEDFCTSYDSYQP
jgi:hypothetical protein